MKIRKNLMTVMEMLATLARVNPPAARHGSELNTRRETRAARRERERKICAVLAGIQRRQGYGRRRWDQYRQRWVRRSAPLSWGRALRNRYWGMPSKSGTRENA